jgi:hypothetical protein
MVRKLAVSGCIALLALVVGCTGSSSTASRAASGRVSAITAVSAASPCPATGTKKFSRTLFVTDAGLVAGAFRKWIYTPYQHGAFGKGVPGRSESIAKAGVAGQFVLSRLQVVKVSAQSDPPLCKLTIGAIDKLTSTVRAMVTKARKGSVSKSQVTSAAAYLSRLQVASAEAHAAFKARSVSSLPASD